MTAASAGPGGESISADTGPSPLRGAIVAMNRQHIIGVDGNLPWHYPADLQRFKRRTLGKIVVMGRLTWQSIGSKPLPGRRNIVLTSRALEGVEVMGSIHQVLNQCSGDDIWFIGGGQIYRAVFDQLNLLDVTWVPDQVDAASPVYFPEIDTSQWRKVSEEPLEGAPGLVNSIYQRSV